MNPFQTNKINKIKIIREVTGQGLLQSKQLFDVMFAYIVPKIPTNRPIEEIEALAMAQLLYLWAFAEAYGTSVADFIEHLSQNDADAPQWQRKVNKVIR